MKKTATIAAFAGCLLASTAWAGPGTFNTFEFAGSTPADITSTRDAFRSAIGGGTVAGANGSFGGQRREINWDGVPDGRSDPNALPNDFFNVNSPRGAVFSTPGSGFLVSAKEGQPTPSLFGFSDDLQTFSAQRLFTAVNSNITDVTFFVPGTNIAATTQAFGAIFVDVEMAGQTKMEFFNAAGTRIYEHDALVAGNKGLSFLGAMATDGAQISRVRLTSGSKIITANGSLGSEGGDLVVMDDFLYAEPAIFQPTAAVPEPSSLALLATGMVCIAGIRRRVSSQRAS